MLLLILAGTRGQADDYAHFKGLDRNEYRVVSDAASLHGIARRTIVAMVGSWQGRKDIGSLLMELRIREAICLHDTSW